MPVNLITVAQADKSTPQVILQEGHRRFFSAGVTFIKGSPCEIRVLRPGRSWSANRLRKTYQNILALARRNQLSAVTIPLLTGNTGFDRYEDYKTAYWIAGRFTAEHPMVVNIVIDPEDLPEHPSQDALRRYLQEAAKETPLLRRRELAEDICSEMFPPYCPPSPAPDSYKQRTDWNNKILSRFSSLEAATEDRDPAFGETLKQFLKDSGRRGTDVYLDANISKTYFYDLKKQKNPPPRETMIALAIGMRLDLDSAQQFLMEGGYILGNSQPDKIIRFFISTKNFSLTEINIALLRYRYSPL